MEAVVSILIPAIVENVFGALTEAVGLSDWLRQRLGRDPEKLAFHQALTQALTDSTTHYPGRDLRYFAEILRDIGGPLLARTLQPAAPLPTADELTTVWLNHLTVDSLIHYQGEFTQFATHFLDRLQFHLENQQPLQWIVQARRQRSSEEAIRRMADVAEQSATNIEALGQEIARLMATLATMLQTSSSSTVTTGGGAYNAGTINAQNFAGRDLTINNYIVDGLVHVASYNPVRRIRRFLNEYLGSAENPVPFGGRQAQLDELNGWIDDPTAQPYYLLAAEAGRGKSALVCRWMAQLMQRGDVEVVFIPISIRFEMASQKEVFEALAARLAKIHQEAHRSEATRAVLSPEQWRTVCESYLDRPAPVGKQLVVILDGLDEATDWQLGAGFFSDEPPPGLRVLVTARLRASETTPQAWAATLGWPARLARLQTLLPLSRSGVEEALVSMGNPLDKLANQQAVIDQLYRLSEEGDPLLVKLYVNALVAKGAQAAFLRAEELAQLNPGLHEYFEQWWKGQKTQWQAEGRNPLRTEQSVLHLLNLLSAALGPLKKADLGELAPEQFTDGILLDEWLTDINRWVIGDGVEQGYTFSHPKFGYYFWEKMFPHQQQELDKRFTDWGAQVLDELNAELLDPKQAPEYLLRNYANHLERNLAPAEAFYAMISNGWRMAWEKLDISYGGFLNDVDRAWEQARSEHAANQLGRSEALVQQVRAALCRSSVATLSSNMPPELLEQVVKAELYTPVQALMILKLVPDEKQRVEMIEAVAAHLPFELLGNALNVTSTVENEYFRANALGQLALHLPAEFIGEALIIALTISDPYCGATALSAIAPHLPDGKRGQTLDEVLHIVRTIEQEELRTHALCDLALHLPESEQVKALNEALATAITIKDAAVRAHALSVLAPHLNGSNRRKALEEGLRAIRAISEGKFFYFTLNQQESSLFVTIAPLLPDELLQEALHVARITKYPSRNYFWGKKVSWQSPY